MKQNKYGELIYSDHDVIDLVMQGHDPAIFADMIVDQFDEMVRQCEHQPLVFSLALHPFITGQPFRLGPLRRALEHCLNHPLRDRVWWTRPRDIADHCYRMAPGILTEG